MVNTGQGLVLGATTGSRPQLGLLLAESPASGSLLLFTGRWTLWELQGCDDFWALDWVFNPLFRGWRGLLVDCGRFAVSSGGGCGSVRSLAPPWAEMQWCVLALPWHIPVSFRSWGGVCSCSSVWLCWRSGWTSKLFVLFWTSACGGFTMLTSLATKGVLEVLDWRLMGAFRRRTTGVTDWGDKAEEGFSWDWDERQEVRNKSSW